jgi:hypothetical protein
MSMTTDTPETKMVIDETAVAIREALTWVDPEDPADEYGRVIEYNVINGLLAIAHALNRVADALSTYTPMSARPSRLRMARSCALPSTLAYARKSKSLSRKWVMACA